MEPKAGGGASPQAAIANKYLPAHQILWGCITFFIIVLQV
jgi:hypothetical protein